MILAAGRGVRLGAMTASKPKPLIPVGGKPMIEHMLNRLKEAGVTECVINLHYLGKMIHDTIGDGSAWGMKIFYSWETEYLNTGGGVKHALSLLGPSPFLLVNADILHDADLRVFVDTNLASLRDGHLLLSPTRTGTTGDFSLKDGVPVAGTDYTFCGISLLRPQIFDREQRRSFPLADTFQAALWPMARDRLTAEEHSGYWADLGTPEALAAAQKMRMYPSQ